MRRSAIAMGQDLRRAASPSVLVMGSSPPQPLDLSEAVKNWMEHKSQVQRKVPVTILSTRKVNMWYISWSIVRVQTNKSMETLEFLVPLLDLDCKVDSTLIASGFCCSCLCNPTAVAVVASITRTISWIPRREIYCRGFTWLNFRTRTEGFVESS